MATIAVLAVLAIALLWRRSDSGDDDSDSSVWNAIPSRQYDGRHVESGGLARGEQERALADIQEQADELSKQSENE